MAENMLQKTANEIVEWTKETGFNISVEKTKAMLIHRRKPRVYERPKLKVRLGPNAIKWSESTGFWDQSYYMTDSIERYT
jgi:tRNA nucleotidyltransferase (CCA-adding enzyme)